MIINSRIMHCLGLTLSLDELSQIFILSHIMLEEDDGFQDDIECNK